MKLTKEQIGEIALREYPDPQYNSHWEHEKVRFLRRGFIKGMEMMQEQTTDLYEQIRVLQADKEIRDANQERLDRVNRELVDAADKVILARDNYLTTGEIFVAIVELEQALENAKQ